MFPMSIVRPVVPSALPYRYIVSLVYVLQSCSPHTLTRTARILLPIRIDRLHEDSIDLLSFKSARPRNIYSTAISPYFVTLER
jgi:hypothetical protein